MGKGLHLAQRLLGLALACLALPGVTCADDASPPLSAEAQAVLDAAGTGDVDRLRDLVEGVSAPPFVIVHELAVHGRLDAARAYVGASDRRDVLRAREYLGELRRRRPSMAGWRKKLQAYALIEAGRWFELSELLTDVRIETATKDVPGVSLLYAKATAAANLDRAKAACPLFLQAAEIAESIGWLAGAGEMLLKASDAAYETRDFESLLEARERVLRVWTLAGDREQIAQALYNLGCVYGNLEDYHQAIQSFKPALEEYGDVLGDELRVHLLAHMGLAYLRRGHLAPAIDILNAALEEARALEYEDLVALTEEYAGLSEMEVREFEIAEAHFRRALEHHEKAYHLEKRADVHGNLGLLAWYRDDLGEADDEWRLAAALYEKASSPTGAARALVSRASVLRRRGELEAAYRMLRTVLDELDARDDPVARCDALHEIALVCRAKEDYPRAFSYRHLHLQMARESASVEAEVTSLGQLAWLHVDRGQYAEAIRQARGAVELLGLLFDRLPTVQAALTRERTAPVYEAGLAAAVALNDADEACFFLEGGRAGALLTALEGRSDIRADRVDPAVRAREAAARTVEAVASREYLEAVQANDLPRAQRARRRMEAAREDLRRIVREIQLAGGLAADLLYPAPLERRKIQAEIAAGTVLVSYGTFGEDALVALVLGPDFQRIVPLGSATGIDALAATTLGGVRTARAAHDSTALRKAIVSPLDLPEGTTRVLVSPVGRISYVPPALLFGDLPVVFVPSASTFVRLDTRPDEVGQGVLAVGDPAYDTRPVPRELKGAALFRGGGLDRLPATRLEAKAVGTTVLLGENASETKVRAALARSQPWHAIHFACHGLVNEDRPSYSALALTPTDEDDGYLRAIDVFRMQIATDLAVLSGCETGRGRLVKAEGIVGLTSAFLVAGAPRVLVSLWKVEDEATRALMERFYELWNPPEGSRAEPLPAAKALRLAQDHVRTLDRGRGKRGWAHPYFWAGWALWGAADGAGEASR